ncbi:MAG TPA: hypothetical protein VGG98_11480 [Solirubrobacteraceae bacterium]|jgi:hypothetical protein
MALVFAAAAMPAMATPPPPPRYALSIVAGETTQPEYQIVHTSGSVQPSSSVAVSIVRNGTVVARNTGTSGGAWMSQVPQVGDVVTLESPVGTTVGAIVYDGLPSIDPTVCAGSASFSGQRSAGEPVEGGYFSLTLHTDPYGHTSLRETASGQAQVTVLAGSSYAGGFLVPLALGQTVFASESLQTPLAGGAVFAYSSETDRPVGACPVPPVVAAPPPPPPALQGSLLKLSRTTIRRLLRSGWRNRVTINQPGTVTQDLYLVNGRLPAYASVKRHGRRVRKPPALLLARGSTSAKGAGEVSVLLRVTPRGRRRLKHAGSVRAVLITTLTNGSGAKLNLELRSVTLHR